MEFPVPSCLKCHTIGPEFKFGSNSKLYTAHKIILELVCFLKRLVLNENVTRTIIKEFSYLAWAATDAIQRSLSGHMCD